MAENKTIHWLKRIFSAQSLTIIIAAASLIIAVLGYIKSTSGELSIQINRKIIPLPKTERQTTRVAELCFVNDSSLILGAKAKIPQLNNLSSRAINNLNYEIIITPNEAVRYQLGDEFEKLNSKVRYKYENLKAYQSVSGPIQSFNFSQRQVHIQFSYNIAFDGVKKPIIFPYDLYIFNNRGEELSSENYLSLRNNFLGLCYSKFKDEKEGNTTIVTVGDTTVSVKNPKFLNLEENPIMSLLELEKDPVEESSDHLWYLDALIYILLSGGLVFSLLDFALLEDFYNKHKRRPTNKELKKTYGQGYFWVYAHIVMFILGLILLLYDIFFM